MGLQMMHDCFRPVPLSGPLMGMSVLGLLLACAGCSVGTVRFQLIDQETLSPLPTQVVFFKKGTVSTNLGYYFTSVSADDQGLVCHATGGIIDKNGKWIPPESMVIDFELYDGEVLYLRADGYRPVEVYIGSGSMTVSESVYNVRAFAAMDRSAKEVRFTSGDVVAIPFRRRDPTTAPSIATAG